MKKRPDSELLQKNGGIIRPTVFFFSKHFGLIHLAGLRVLKHFFLKKSSFPSFLFSSFSLSFSLSSSLHLVSLLHLSSCPLSSLLSIFSSLVFNLLFHLHVSLLSSFISSFLLFHLLVSSLDLSRLFFFLSCLVSLSLSLSLSLCLYLFLSSFSVCLSLSLSSFSVSVSVWCCVLWCVWRVCCVVLCVLCVCGVVCGAAWHAEKTSLCRFETSPCVPAPLAHVLPQVLLT